MKKQFTKLEMAVILTILMHSSKKQRKRIAAFIMFAATFHPKLIIRWEYDDAIDALKAQSVHDKTKASTWMAVVPNLDDIMDAYQVEIDKWIAAIAKAENGTKQDKTDLEVFSANFRSITSVRILELAQGVADANIEHAEQVAVSCDMELKGKGGRSAQEWSVKRVAAGSVELTGAIKGYKSKHYTIQWQRTQTPEDPDSWYLKENEIIPTPYSVTTVNDLPLAKLFYFRYRIITSEIVTDWSYTISLVIS